MLTTMDESTNKIENPTVNPLFESTERARTMLTPVIVVIVICSLFSFGLFLLGNNRAGMLVPFIGSAAIGVIMLSDISTSGVNEDKDSSSHASVSNTSDHISRFLSLRDSEFHGKSN